MKTLKTSIRTILFALAALIIFRCANPVMPTGGPKDKEPPVPMSSIPENYSKNFAGNRIQIEFDEFIQLDDPGNNILISPPVSKKPEYRIRGRSLIAIFDEPLKEQTTYTLFFGNSIIDLNEKNPLSNYQFVFSTGDKIDSLSIKGYAQKAFDLKPQESIYVMLYTNDNDTIPADSLPLLVKPYYVSRTDENGFFELNNIRDLKYKIFALKDINNNMIYDLPNEEIAFLDTLLSPEYFKPPPPPDTTSVDTTESEEVNMENIPDEEALIEDSTIAKYPDNVIYNLYLFDETDSTQALLDAELSASRKILFTFKYPAKNPVVQVLNESFTDNDSWKITDLNQSKDTLIWWLKEIPVDTLHLVISDDTLVLDTTNIIIREESKKPKKNKDEEEQPDFIKIVDNTQAGKIDLNKPLYLNFPYPVSIYNTSGFLLIEDQDTMNATPYFSDSIHRKLVIDREWQEDMPYTLFFSDSLFTDIRGLSNDTVQISFRSKSLGDYGILRINFTPDSSCVQYIVQLMNKEEVVLREVVVNSTDQIVYEFLKPSEFMLKAICDSNKNGKWDTGDYLKKIQPERVYYFPKTIEVRSNWEIEEDWNLSGPVN